ncbi:hypothetical protein DICVIV_13348 [Dictyocaulus viviparus]|uniref:Uncharacterized protein n=1 Tax=Dictyocaulus viviparus TaxID=29172 RepID=A0A0D8X814_DICVI|nr:hypothetical protein DICVIV_13348 [Dictyocaulus viviparus]
MLSHKSKSPSQLPHVLTVNKKSDMSKFTSAINGASRLRYGKRNIDFGYPLPDKRSALSNKFIQSLNEAERLSVYFMGAMNSTKQIGLATQEKLQRLDESRSRSIRIVLDVDDGDA